jgi:hypothetical protein
LKPTEGFADATRLCAVQALPSRSDVSTTMKDSHVHKAAAGGTVSPLDALNSPARRRWTWVNAGVVIDRKAMLLHHAPKQITKRYKLACAPQNLEITMQCAQHIPRNAWMLNRHLFPIVETALSDDRAVALLGDGCGLKGLGTSLGAVWGL